MFAQQLLEEALASYSQHSGAFYGPADKLAAGVGLIYENFTYPTFNAKDSMFEARQGPILMLTHECDIDQGNVRHFNESFVFAPILTLAGFASFFESIGKKDTAISLIKEIAKNNVSRLFFLPPTTQFMKVPALEFGAVIYWNIIGNGHVRQLADGAVQKACALSEYGLRIVDHRIRESLLRPKTEVLPKTT